jgi:hypothetical protein
LHFEVFQVSSPFTCRDVARRPAKFEQGIASLLIQSLMGKFDLQILQIIWQVRRQWLRIWPINDFARHNLRTGGALARVIGVGKK